jgi:osmotically inducible protein OsmC
METESGAYSGDFKFATRFGDAEGTNPDELIGAAMAGCFSMAFSNELDKAGYTPESVSTTAAVTVEDGEIHTIELVTEGRVPDIDEDTFKEIAAQAKDGCPVGKALAAVDTITLDAKLLS